MRDDFPVGMKETLAKRVGNKCSNPDCGQPTSGPHEDPAKVLNIGVAAHITAASPPLAETAITSPSRIASSRPQARAHGFHDFGQRAGDVRELARKEFYRIALLVDLHARAVQFGLQRERPVHTLEELGHGFRALRQHRLERHAHAHRERGEAGGRTRPAFLAG